MSKGSDAPEPIDPVAAIEAQARANRVNLSSPFGGQRYSQGPDGQWTAESYLSPELQALVDGLIGKAGQGPQQFQIPGMDGLMQNVMGRVGGHYSGQAGAKPAGTQLMPPPNIRGRG